MTSMNRAKFRHAGPLTATSSLAGSVDADVDVDVDVGERGIRCDTWQPGRILSSPYGHSRISPDRQTI